MSTRCTRCGVEVDETGVDAVGSFNCEGVTRVYMTEHDPAEED